MFAYYYLFVLASALSVAWLCSRFLPFHKSVDSQELKSGRMVPLDGLRGILALSVFASHGATYWAYAHSNDWSPPSSQFFAQTAVAPVSMFFFITGFLFWGKLHRNPRFERFEFWLSRFGRLYPVYVAACLAAFLYAAILSHFEPHIPLFALVKQAGAWLGFFSISGLNGLSEAHYWLSPAWSLRFEWIFYLSLPFLGWFARRPRNTFILLVPALLISILLRYFLPARLSHFPWTTLISYLHFLGATFAVGILAAILPLDRFKPLANTTIASILALASAAVTFWLIPPEYSVWESLGLALPFLCVRLGNDFWGFFSSRVLRFLGRISYSFYLLHLFTLFVCMRVLQAAGILARLSLFQYWLFASLIVGIVVIVAAFSYQFLEHPFLHVRLRRHAK